MGDPTSSYATAGITLTVSVALKPHHHDMVETPSVRIQSAYAAQMFLTRGFIARSTCLQHNPIRNGKDIPVPCDYIIIWITVMAVKTLNISRF
jgi:hypothetical protein